MKGLEQQDDGDGMNGEEPAFYGKYRGVVTDNKDPKMLGRIRARVPDVFGEHQSGWAMPSMPYAGQGVGLFLIPPKDAFVWIEFEHGDADYPIWTGCFWAEGEVPAAEGAPEIKMLKTEIGAITMHDTANGGEISIATTRGMKIVVNADRIEITNGQGGTVKLAGPQVSVNNGALEVT